MSRYHFTVIAALEKTIVIAQKVHSSKDDRLSSDKCKHKKEKYGVCIDFLLLDRFDRFIERKKQSFITKATQIEEYNTSR